MESKTFLDFLPTNFRHEKSFFIQNNLADFEQLSNLSDVNINMIQRKSPLCTSNNLKKGSRSGSKVKIKIRKLEKISENISKPIILGETEKTFKMN